MEGALIEPVDVFPYRRRVGGAMACRDPVTDELIGVISHGALLKERDNQALMLGDEIAEAKNGVEMGRIRARLPALARSLLDEKLSVLDVAAVLSAVLRDISARAAELAAESLVAEGQGAAPAPWGYLILGSGGRGGSRRAADPGM